jgi:hypothetical protein
MLAMLSGGKSSALATTIRPTCDSLEMSDAVTTGA